MEIEKFFNKKYKMERCENLDEMLIEIGKLWSFCVEQWHSI